ncbi:hypothetical protein Riv7116_5327 [Rivularia sp. PCC 7116]|uniref:hypothetical protein n=1 Tax=Rivularia sp. PCC 7116 TaxID=373994 RepID=UPI00029F4D3F|nr:hypothetical protein [Rivularia sp. PCC 7116]AFY57709.1 hypothetical protein Riv7116_5327 [Rivularia sp. PCC 7116]
MLVDIQKYKLCTANSVSKTDALTYFIDFICEETLYKNKPAYRCVEDSLLIFHPSGIENLIFLEIHCRIIGKPGTGRVNFKSAIKFMKFCVWQKTDMKIPRDKSIIPASEGALMSDLFNSQSFKKAMHNACYKYRVNKKRNHCSEHSQPSVVLSVNTYLP